MINILSLISIVLTCTVISVHDGDTVTAICEGMSDRIKVRMLGMDAPEVYGRHCTAQPYSIVAKRRLTELVKGKVVELDRQGTDVYGRTLATIYLNGMDINCEMVKEGLAEVYRGDVHYENHPYYKHEESARNSNSGMWWLVHSGEYESPRVYRARCNNSN